MFLINLNVSLLLFLLFHFWHVESQCISNDVLNCIFCSYNYYDSRLTEHVYGKTTLKKEDCIPKSIPYCERHILIQSNSSTKMLNFPFFDEIYFDFFNSVLNESKIVSNCFESKIIFYFSKGSHFILHSSFPFFKTSLFERMNAKIIMKPFYCLELNTSGELCNHITENPIVWIQKSFFSIVISGSMELQNLFFYENQNNDLSDINSLNQGENAVFQMETIYDDINIEIPSLNISDVVFINFLLPIGKSLISIDYFGGNLNIKNLSLSNCLLWNILIFDDISSLKNVIYSYLGFKKYLEDFNKNKNQLISEIHIKNLFLENCNQYTLVGKNNSNINSLIFMNYYRGNIIVKNFVLINFRSHHLLYLFYFNKCSFENKLTQISLQNIDNFNLFYIEQSNTLIQNVSIQNSSWNNYAIYLFNNTKITMDSLVMIQSSSNKQGSSFIFLYATFSEIFIESHHFRFLSDLYFQFFNTILTISNSTYQEINKFEIKFQYCSFLSINTRWNKIWGFNSFLQFQACPESYIIKNQIVNFDGSSFISGFSVSNLTIAYSNFLNLSNMNYVLDKAIIFKTLSILHSSFTNLKLNLGFAYSVTNLVLLIDSSQYVNVSIFGKMSLSFIRVQVGLEIIQLSSFVNVKIFAGGNAIFGLIRSSIIVKSLTIIDCGFAYPIYADDLTSIEYSELFYFWKCDEILFQNNTLLISGNINLFSGLLYCTLVQINLTVEGNIFKYMNKVPNNYYTGVILSNAPILILMNNKFHNIQCPDFSSFIHNNGAVSLQGDASYKSLFNKKTCILINNLFFDCHCRYGGSLGIINYGIIQAKNLYFYNSTASVGGGIFLAGSSFASFDSIIFNHTYAYHSHTMYLMNILEIILTNFTINNALSVKSSGFRINNVLKIKFNHLKVINATSLNFGGVFYLQLGNTFISDSIFFLCQALNGGILFINQKGNITIDKILALKTSSKFGGAFYIDSINRVEINQSIFHNISSIFQGGALFINMVSILKIHDSIFSFCESLNNGIIYLKNSETNSDYFLQNISCSSNKAFSGSCIFAEAKGTLKIFRMISEASINSSLFFSTDTELNVKLEGATFFNCSANYIVYATNIEFIMDEIIFERNKVNESIFYVESCLKLKLNYVSFLENHNKYISISIPLIYIRDSAIFCSHIRFTQIPLNEHSFYFMETIKSNIFLSFSNFSQLTYISDYFIYIEKGIFKCEFLLFNQTKGVIITLSNSNMTINNSIFLNNVENNLNFISDFLGSSLYQNQNFIYLANSYFRISSNISMQFINFNLIIINFCYFDGNTISRGIKLKEVAMIKINDCILKNFINPYNGGGALSIISGDFTNILMKNTSFFNNLACYSGAFIIEGLFEVKIYNCSFNNNKALFFGFSKCGVAGVAMFLCINYNKCLAILEGNLFHENFADLMSPNIHSFSELQEKNNEFKNNSEESKIQSKFFSYPLSIQLNNQNLTISSGKLFPLYFNLVDAFNQTVSFNNHLVTASLLKSKNSSNFINLQNTNSNLSYNGLFKFDDLIIIETPNSNFSVEFQFSMYNSFLQKNLIFIRDFTFFSRPCVIGEILTPDKKCQICDNGYFSFINPMNTSGTQICRKCVKNAFCPGGNILYPRAGFWRFGSNSTEIIQCKTLESCLGSGNSIKYDENLIKGLCLEGHSGNLCDNCKKGYGKFSSDGICYKCSENIHIMNMKIIFVSLLICAYVLLNTYAFSRKMTTPFNILTVLSKIFINHLQKLTVIISFDENVKIIQFLDVFHSFISLFSFTNQDSIANDCILAQFIKNYEDFYLVKCLLSLLFPVIVSIASVCLLSLFDLCYYIKKKKHYINFRRIYLTFLISVFLFYLLITKYSLSLLKCISFSESKEKYLFASPNIMCWSGKHKTTVIIMLTSGILAWGILFPLFLLAFLRKNNKKYMKEIKYMISSNSIKLNLRLMRRKNRNKVGNLMNSKHFDPYFFFYKDFTQKRYYWAVVLFFYQLFFSMLQNLNSLVNGDELDLIFLFGVMIYCLFLLKLMPFKTTFLNHLECCSNFIFVLSRLFAILSRSLTSSSLKFLFSFAFLFVNIVFLVVLGYLFCKYLGWKKCLLRFRSKITKSILSSPKNILQKDFENIIKVFKINKI